MALSWIDILSSLNHTYNNISSGLTATTTKDAVDELSSTKAPLASPALTGNPTAPTPTAGDADTSIATTAFVRDNVANSNLPVSQLIDGTISISDTTTTDVQVTKTYTGTGASNSIVTGINSVDSNYSASTTYAIGDFTFDRTKFGAWIALTAGSGNALPTARGDSNANWQAVTLGQWYDHDSSRVWIKNRDTAAYNHHVVDSLRGSGNAIWTDLTDAEGAFGNVGFTSTGFTLDNYYLINSSAKTYVAWQQAYHKIMLVETTVNGVASGKYALVAADDVSNRSMVLYQGSGTAGHEIPHGLGDSCEFTYIKQLGGSGNWQSVNLQTPVGSTMVLDLDLAEGVSVASYTIGNNITLSTGNEQINADESYIAYCEASSDNIKIGTYSGTGAAGNEVYCGEGFKPSYVMFKRVDTAEDWGVVDNTRGIGVGNTKYLFPNLSSIEVLSGYNTIELTATGLTLLGTGSLTNALGAEYLYIAYADTNYNGGGSTADLPSLTSNLQIANGSIGYSAGGDANGAVNTCESITGTIIPSNGWQQGMNYVKKTEAGVYTATLNKPRFGSVDGFADFYVNGRWYEKHNLFSNGDFNDGSTGWTAQSAWAVTNKQLVAPTSTSSTTFQTKTFETKLYKLTFDIVEYTSGTVSARIGGDIPTGFSEVGSHSTIFDVTAGSLIAGVVGISFVGVVDNISVSSLDESDWTPYTTPITYLPNAYEADSSGNVVDIHDAIMPEITANAIAVKDIVGLDKPLYQGYVPNNQTASAILPLSQLIDTHNGMSGGIYTFPKKGWYKLSGKITVQHAASAGDGYSNIEYYINGFVYEKARVRSTDAYTITPCPLHSIVYVEEGDTFHVYFSRLTTNIDVVGASDNTSMVTIQFLGDNLNA